jgi:hypothetical protein
MLPCEYAEEEHFDETHLVELGLVLGWIGKGCGDTSLHGFIPPSGHHELYFMIMYDIMTALTYVLSILDLSLFWFMMKHRGRCSGTMLEWFD